MPLLPSNFYARLLTLNAIFSIVWATYHYILRKTLGNRRKAADMNSFTYCLIVGLVWNIGMIYTGIFSVSMFWKNPFACPLVGVADLYVEIYFVVQIAYNVTDVVFDNDPNFYVHHFLCIAGSLTPLLRRFDMASGMVVNLFVAELGSVPYHVSRMAKSTFLEAFMRRVFLYLYGGTRLLCYLPMAVFGAVRFFQVGWTTNFGDSAWNFWCVVASFAMLFINIRWFLRHWSKRGKYDDDEVAESTSSANGSSLNGTTSHDETVRRRRPVAN